MGWTTFANGAVPDAHPDIAAPIQFPSATTPTAAPAPAAPPANVPTPEPAPGPVDSTAPVFVEEEAGEVAIFQAGTVRYSVTMRADGVTKRRVVIRRGACRCQMMAMTTCRRRRCQKQKWPRS
jgi:hypothetical protein